MMRHPSEAELALHAGGDLSLAARLRVAWHLRGCPDCAAAASRFAESRRKAGRLAGELPPDLDWESRAGEMRANIRLGLAAGAAVTRPQASFAPEGFRWRLAVVTSTLAFVAVAGWLLRAPQPLAPPVSAALESPAPPAGILLDAQPDGLAVRERGAELTLLGPGRQPLTTTVSWDGGAGARFMDAETAQVTIYNVAAQ